MVGRISTKSRFVIDITRTDPLSLGELGGSISVCWEKLEKMRYLNLRTGDRTLMKFIFRITT